MLAKTGGRIEQTATLAGTERQEWAGFQKYFNTHLIRISSLSIYFTYMVLTSISPPETLNPTQKRPEAHPILPEEESILAAMKRERKKSKTQQPNTVVPFNQRRKNKTRKSKFRAV
jgi:hypothetical protein